MIVLAATFNTGTKFHGFHGGSLAILVASGIAALLWLFVFSVRWVRGFPKLPAAGRVGDLDEVSGDDFVVRLKPRHDDDAMTPYERQVLDVVKARATGGSA